MGGRGGPEAGSGMPGPGGNPPPGSPPFRAPPDEPPRIPRCLQPSPNTPMNNLRLSAMSCNHRRHALTNLVRVLYGRRAAADLIDLARFRPPPPKPRWLSRRHIAEVVPHITPGSLTRVRLELRHWNGMRPSQMARLQLDDFRLDDPIPYVAIPRGKGGRAAAVPLVPEGIAAARAFLDARAFGPWSRGSANKALRAAARRAALPSFTLYQTRHSFAAGLRRTGADVADIQDLYGHTSPRTPKIYAPPELPKHRAAMERLRQSDASGPTSQVLAPVSRNNTVVPT